MHSNLLTFVPAEMGKLIRMNKLNLGFNRLQKIPEERMQQ